MALGLALARARVLAEWLRALFAWRPARVGRPAHAPALSSALRTRRGRGDLRRGWRDPARIGTNRTARMLAARGPRGVSEGAAAKAAGATRAEEPPAGVPTGPGASAESNPWSSRSPAGGADPAEPTEPEARDVWCGGGMPSSCAMPSARASQS